MIKQCKKAISTVLSILILPAFIGNLQGSSVQAENEAFNTTILYGDANLDGGITPNDALCITNYLLGKNFATPAQFTAMDYNRDKVVDQYDAQKIMIDALYGYSYNYTNSFYTVPDNSARTYYKHICNTGTSSTYSSYQISAATNPISNSLSVADESLLISNDRTIDLPDNENTCCVKVIAKDYTNATIEYRASGFIMKNGDVLQISQRKAEINGKVTSGEQSIDEEDNIISEDIIKERKSLAAEGVITFTYIIHQNRLQGKPHFNSRGFVYMKSSNELINDLTNKAYKIANSFCLKYYRFYEKKFIETMQHQLEQYIYEKCSMRPVVIIIPLQI